VAVFFAVVLYGLIALPYQSELKVLVRRGGIDPVVTPGAIVPLRAHRRGDAALPDQLERFHSPGPGRKCARRQPLRQPTANRPVGAMDGSIAAPQCRERRRIGTQILMVELKSTRVVGQSAVPENPERRG
jgi:hypothetical protein